MVILGIFKLVLLLLKDSNFTESVWWSIFALGWTWNGWAYWKDLDMIGRNVGVVEYKNGKNQTMRTTYIVFMVGLFVLGVFAV